MFGLVFLIIIIAIFALFVWDWFSNLRTPRAPNETSDEFKRAMGLPPDADKEALRAERRRRKKYAKERIREKENAHMETLRAEGETLRAERRRKKEYAEESRREKKKAEKALTNEFYEEIESCIKNDFKIVASAYRKSVTSNSFGKKNYTKFIPELIEFLEDQPAIIEIKTKLKELHGVQISLSFDESMIKFIEKEIDRLDRDTDYTDDMDPFDYEHYCAVQFKKNGWDAEATQGSSDQGVDVVASKNGLTIVAQCKKFAKPVGNKAVQEIVAGKKHYRANKGIVIAPNGFTNSAVKLAESNNIALIHHTEIKDL